MAKLAEIMPVLHFSSDGAKRGFAAMKRIKTDSRNRIAESKFKALMMIFLQVSELSSTKYFVIKFNNIFNAEKTQNTYSQC